MAKEHFNDINHLNNLLITKLEIPLLGARIVMRDRLLGLLNQALHFRVTLITAPTGYGKTTLLVEWMTAAQAQDRRTVWISLDSLDNAPLRLWSYVVTALKKVYPRLQYNLQQMLQRGYDPHDPALLNPLINEISQIPYPLCLVLDDYQAINDADVHNSLGYFIDHQPANLHLILSSRSIPPLQLARLRARRQLLEITAQDLAFTLPEAKSFLTNVMDLDVDAAMAAALFEATEGWIAGLQLAALSGSGRQIAGPLSVHHLQDNRQILDYLTLEVLNEQNDAIKEFLLKTSILSELCPPLCDFILDRSDSQELLARVEKANLFLMRLDRKQNWYRYHPLFAETLEAQLKYSFPNLLAELHSKACDWLLEHHYPEKAVSHALAAGDSEKAVDIVENCAMQAIIDYDIKSLLDWISYFDGDLFTRRPRLGIYHALATFHEGHAKLAEQSLQKVDQVLEHAARHGISPQEEKVLRWEASAIRAANDCLVSSTPQAITAVLELLSHRPKEDDYFNGFIHYALAEAYLNAGELESAYTAFDMGCQFAVPHRNLIQYVHARCEAARVRMKQGRLNDAREAYLDAIDFGREVFLDDIVLALPQSGLLEIAIERNNLSAAQSLAPEIAAHLDQIETAPSMRFFHGMISTRLSRYYLAIHDIERAQLYFQKALKDWPRDVETTPILPYELTDLQIRLYTLVSQQINIRWDLPSTSPIKLGDGYFSTAAQVTMAKVALAQRDYSKARSILESLEPVIRNTGFDELILETRVLLALVYFNHGEADKAVQWLGKAIHQAESEGYIRIFIDEGEPMKGLLLHFLDRQDGAESSDERNRDLTYARRLVEFFADDSGIHPQYLIESLPETIKLEPPIASLSQREMEVLEILISGKSVKEIAVALKISINTAKVHVKNIYRKLGTHSRKVVFERADELGILRPLTEPLER